MTDTLGKTALVLGATGGIGGETAAALIRRGWDVRALVRDPTGAAARWRRPEPSPIWQAGDAMDAATVLDAAHGVDVVVHAVNPPGYRDWDRLVLPMLDNSIAAAAANGATIVLPGTVYNYGPDAFPVLHEDSPQHPTTRKGGIRVAMERRLQAASDRGLRVLILRCGDFFGPHAGNNWFAQGLIRPGKPLRRIVAPGRRGIGHQWAYLPDAGETLARLIVRRAALPGFARFHMKGHWDADGRAMTGAIQRAAGRRLPVWPFPWLAVRLAARWVRMFREIEEMRYLWEVPLRMDNACLLTVLEEEPHTPLDAAVATTLRSLGCLPDVD